MKLGLIGLGKMGYHLALNMKDHGIEVVAYDVTEEARNTAKKAGIEVASSYQELLGKLPERKVVWLMVPSGKITESVLHELLTLLKKDDIVIDGGNSNFHDTVRRHALLKSSQIYFVDCGTSGGMDGARNGASLMVGGDKEVIPSIEEIFLAVATTNGYAYLGESGAGHFAKMVHNGIEYGMMQAIGEGFDLLESSDYQYDYEKVSRVWANGSIIEGLLLRSIHHAFQKESKLESLEGIVDDSGEGQWTIEEALKKKVSIPVIAGSLFARYKSKDVNHFSEKVVSAMRNEFGGHKVYKK
ncbi:MAG: phosphogluconate dehydrogenase (NAD(+)-dependent, decarboxylating) [Candidatus Izemoplasmatales bacterium]